MNAPPALLDTSVAVETPEHIVFEYRVAGPARRMLAYLVDLVVCYGALLVLLVLVLALAFGLSSDDMRGAAAKMGTGVALVLLFAAQWVYFVAWEGLRGSTPGKAAAGLRVVTTAGRPIGFAGAALRNVLRAADALPVGYAVGLFAMAISPRFQRLGDLVADTMVVVKDRAPEAKMLRVVPRATPSELAYLPDTVRLDVEERTAIEIFLRRRGTLGPAREHELAQMIAPPLERRFGYRLADPARMLAILYERAVDTGRSDGPPSSMMPAAIGAIGKSDRR